jgi:hypothetical protein
VKPITASLVLAASLFAVTSVGATDTITVFHKFVGGNDGDDPSWLIQASDGNFYGTTYLSTLGYGSTVFKVTPDGQFTTLFRAPYNPNGTNHYPDGNTYTSIVEGPDGFLYVVGSTIFKISKSGTDFQLLEVGEGVQALAGLGRQLLWLGRQRDISAHHQWHLHSVVCSEQQRVHCGEL